MSSSKTDRKGSRRHHDGRYDCDEVVKCPPGPTGPRGPPGPPGCMGAPGPRGFADCDPDVFTVAMQTSDAAVTVVDKHNLPFSTAKLSSTAGSPVMGSDGNGGQNFEIKKKGTYLVELDINTGSLPAAAIREESWFDLHVNNNLPLLNPSLYSIYVAAGTMDFHAKWYIDAEVAQKLSIYYHSTYQTGGLNFTYAPGILNALLKITLIDGW